MILHKLDYLNKKKIILASKSPRRIQLLSDIGLNFQNVDSNANENSKSVNPAERSLSHALDKLKLVQGKITDFDLIISADTVVYHNDIIMEKPKDRTDALKTLKHLSDDYHEVYSSVILKTQTEQIQFTEKSSVELYYLSDFFINAYINSNEPMDKAGSYGIQGIGSSFVKSVKGCYYNVMGLPVSRICLNILNLINDKKL